MGRKNNQRKKSSFIRALVICHGKSEIEIANAFQRDLRLPLIIDSENNGTKSIQINSIMKFLGKRQYVTLFNFLHQIPGTDRIQISRKKELKDFKVFIIMDTDDCDNPKTLQQYIDGSMFSGHWLAPYIVPIFLTPNLDIIFESLGFSIDRADKPGSYFKACQKIVAHDDWPNWLIKQLGSKNFVSKTNCVIFLKYLDKISERHNH